MPVLVGAVAGLGIYGLLRLTLGGTSRDMLGPGSPPIALVPTTVTPAWWQFLLIIVVISAAGVITGWRASRRVVVTPLGIARRQTAPPPRPWGLLLLAS